MVHMPNLESWEWSLEIFDGAPTLTTHVEHLHVPSIHKTHKQSTIPKLGTCTAHLLDRQMQKMTQWIRCSTRVVVTW